MKILFLSRWFPFPPSNGSKLRIHNILCGLAQEHEIVLLSFYEEDDVRHNEKLEHPCCAETHVVPWRGYQASGWRTISGYLQTRPRYYADTFSLEIADSLQRLLREHEFDLAIVSQIDMAGYGHLLKGTPAVFEEAELGIVYDRYTKSEKFSQRLRAGLTWFKLRRYLLDMLKHFDACTVVSEREKGLLVDELNYDETFVIPNGISVPPDDETQSQPKSNSLIFTGALSYQPNYQAMIWFLHDVYPLVRQQVADVHLYITGNPSGYDLSAHEGVTQTGFVDDIAQWVRESSVSVVPLLTGGGTRLKILESMALGTPVVSTSKGAEGLDVASGKHLLIADQPAEFAQQVVSLLNDEATRRQLAKNAKKLVREQYDWPVIMPRLLSLVEEVCA